MTFNSSKLVVIDDNNYRRHISPVVDGERKSRGYAGMFPRGAESSVKTFEDMGIPLIPTSEIDDRIDYLEKNGCTLPDLARDMGLAVLDQNGTNYCWINATAFCAMLIRLKETGQVVRYSPASAGARIKNFSNVGGWGWEGLEWMTRNGINLQSDWPPNAISRSYDTAENREKAKANIVLEFFRLRSHAEELSCVLHGIPTSTGYNWWGHQVATVHYVKGSHDKVIANSWGTGWGDQGYGVLSGSRKNGDYGVAVCAMIPS